MKVLLTGGAGYVGSHVAKYLHSLGITPVVYDNLTRGHRHNVKWGELEEGDILDADRLRAVLAIHKPDAIIHLAALAYVGESAERAEDYYWTNVVGTLTLVETMKEAGCDRLVFSSSCAVFHPFWYLPIGESELKRPGSPYGRTKLAAEGIIQDSGIRHVTLRYFNAAGADPDLEIGEEHSPETHLIPLAIEAAYSGNALTLNGDNYDTWDGTCVRDFVHVWDLAQAHAQAVTYLIQGGQSDSFNLGSGKGTSVKQLVGVVNTETLKTIDVRTGPRRTGDYPYLVANPDRAKEVLGWDPKYPNIHSIVASAVAWRNRKAA